MSITKGHRRRNRVPRTNQGTRIYTVCPLVVACYFGSMHVGSCVNAYATDGHPTDGDSSLGVASCFFRCQKSTVEIGSRKAFEIGLSVD